MFPAEPREWLGELQARQDFVFSTHTDSLAFGSEWLPSIIFEMLLRGCLNGVTKALLRVPGQLTMNQICS